MPSYPQICIYLSRCRIFSGLFLAAICNQSQLAERRHVARYWSINTAATAVPLSAHSVSYYNEISGGLIGRAVVRKRCSVGTVLPLWSYLLDEPVGYIVTIYLLTALCPEKRDHIIL